MQNNKWFFVSIFCAPFRPLRLSSLLGLLFLLAVAAADPADLWGQNVVKKGSWTKASYKAKGEWRIVEQNGTLELQLGEDFETTNAPDLNLILSPYAPKTLSGRNALNNALTVGLLKGKKSWGKLKGPITLKFPANVDLAKYKTIAIHCIAYSKLWVVSEL